MKTDKKMILHRAEEVFFEAMRDGYAGERKNSTISIDENGFKIIDYMASNFEVVDRYCVTPFSDFSDGTTTIFYRHNDVWVPVWSMHYSGRYPENTIPFLKSALGEAYKANKFYGGRGEDMVGKELYKEFLYLNFFSGHFSSFEGKESIRSIKTGTTLGFHRYFGSSML